MEPELVRLETLREELLDAIAEVGASDVPNADKTAQIKRLNREIARIDIAVANHAATELNAAARQLLTRTHAAANNVLKNVLSGLKSEVAAVVEAVKRAIRDITDDPLPVTPNPAPKPMVAQPVRDDPVLLRKTSRVRAVYGHLVRALQVSLTRLEFGPNGIDMIFGEDTADALKAWRASTARSATEAIVTRADWVALTGTDAPDLFDICAQATAAFEGHGFGLIVGDFDGAVLTWGYHGYTLKYGHLQAVLADIHAADDSALNTAFGPDRSAALIAMLSLHLDAQIAWARDTVLKPDKTVRPEWLEGFDSLGGLEIARTAQLAYSRKTFWDAKARPQAEELGLTEPLGYGMLFDAAIQQGGASNATAQKVAAARAADPDMTEMALREVVADALTAQIKSDRFRADVAARRRTFISGRGQVHGATYDLGFWGFFAEHDEAEGHLVDTATVPAVPVAAATPFAAFYAARVKPIAQNFEASELLSKGGGNVSGICAGKNVDPPEDKWENCIELARILQTIRSDFGIPIRINSCYRSPAYNSCIGGATRSQHMEFRAADIAILDGKSPLSWYKRILDMRNQGLFKGGLAHYNSFVHVDVRGHNADWRG